MNIFNETHSNHCSRIILTFLHLDICYKDHKLGGVGCRGKNRQSKLKAVFELGTYLKGASIDHYTFQVSVIVMIYMIVRFLLFSNATQHAMHHGQNWVFNGVIIIIRWPAFKN